MAKTKAEQLEDVETAISAILAGGQSYTLLGRTYTRASLGTLQEMQQRLSREIARESRGGIKTQRGIAL